MPPAKANPADDLLGVGPLVLVGTVFSDELTGLFSHRLDVAGSVELTATELATIWQRGLTPAVVLVDNAGYTIERVPQSPGAVYQDVTRRDRTTLPAALAPGVDVLTADATTPGRLRAAPAAARQGVGDLHAREEPLTPPRGRGPPRRAGRSPRRRR